MTLRGFKTRKRLWWTVSGLVFVLCWAYPMEADRGAPDFPAAGLWLDVIQGATGLWDEVVLLSVKFGIFAGLVGFVVQATVALLMNRNAQPGGAPNGGPGTPVANSGVSEGPPSVT
jgi:hypothetical protein